MKIKKLLAAAVAMLCTAGAWAQSVGDIIAYNGSEYEVKGANLITNGSFDDGVDGWYSGAWNNASASNYTLQSEGGFDGGAYLQYSAGGVGADTNIRGKWAVETGKTYYFSCYTSGKTPDSNNLQYSKLHASADGSAETSALYQLVWGASAGQTSSDWTKNEFVFTATTSWVVFRSSWTQNAKLDGFVLVEIERYYSPEGYNNAMYAAKAALADESYANVTGEEKTNLENVIATYTDATSDKYEEATLALEEATNAFKAAKSSYDAFVAAKETPVLAYAAEAKKTALDEAKDVTPTSAEDAVAKTAVITTALRAYYESHALAEGVEDAVNMTSRIANPDATDGNNGWTWTGNKNTPRNTESWTDSNGKNDYMYFDGGNWNGTSWTTTMKQNVSIPAGKYLLTAKGRASSNVTLEMSVGEESVALPHVNASGNVFDRGWGDGSVEFESDGHDVTILITASAEPQHEWFSVGDFRLVRLELYTEMAGEAEYAALNEAIAAAEAKTLGFEAGEYAPYNNVEAIAALAAAKVIDQTAENGKEEIVALTNALADENWTANTEEVNAVYDGTLANAPIQATSENVVLPGWTTKSGNTRQTFKGADNEDGGKAALADAIDQVGLFVHPGTYTYGEVAGYTMPLKGGVVYTAEAKYCAWANGSNNNFTLTILKEGETVESKSYGPNSIACTEAGALRTVKLIFTASEDANYVLSVNANGNTFMTDFIVKKAVAEDVTIAVSEAGYATTIVPFAAEVPAGLTVAEVTGVEGNELVLNEVSAIEANKPYVVSGAAGNYTVNGIVATNLEASYTNGLLTGVYADTQAPVGSYVLQNLESKVAFYQVAENAQPTVKAGRAYLTVPAGSEDVKAFVLGGTTDAIQTVEAAEAENGAIYNLAGQRVGKAVKGIYVIQGKKVMVK